MPSSILIFFQQGKICMPNSKEQSIDMKLTPDVGRNPENPTIQSHVYKSK